MRRAARVALVLLLAACGTGTTSGRPSPSTSPTASETAGPTAVPSASPTRTHSAADTLARFFAAAAQADSRLHAAAVLVNGDLHATTATFGAATVAAVRHAVPTAVATAIPAGLPPRLLTAVLVVDSDLVGRAAAMKRVSVRSAPLPLRSPDGVDLLRCLGNGSLLAARYPADLAAATALARSLPPVSPAGARSRAAAEVAVRVEGIRLGHNGCDACGGLVVADLPAITWTARQDPGWAASSAGWTTFGRYGETPFRARYDGSWQVQLLAC